MLPPSEPARPSIPSRFLGIALILLAHAVALCFVMITLCKTVPTYAIFFEQQVVALPLPTQRIVTLSEYCVAYNLPIFLFLMTADAIVILTLTFSASMNWIRSTYSCLCLLTACGVLMYVGAWLSHPVYSLVR